MITKVIWETLSVALLLYGLYLVYVFLWFSAFKIIDMDIQTAKLLSGTFIGIILIISSYRWFKKKKEELRLLKEAEEN
ncbi:hypothetical protein [Persephonella sp.]